LPHKHMAILVLNDGTLLSYHWAWRGNGESWGIMAKGRGSVEYCTQEEYERTLREIGRKTKKVG
jgi:hypothetical protein